MTSLGLLEKVWGVGFLSLCFDENDRIERDLGEHETILPSFHCLVLFEYPASVTTKRTISSMTGDLLLRVHLDGLRLMLWISLIKSWNQSLQIL